jgi:hypothetical protein
MYGEQNFEGTQKRSQAEFGRVTDKLPHIQPPLSPHPGITDRERAQLHRTTVLQGVSKQFRRPRFFCCVQFRSAVGLPLSPAERFIW